MNVFGTVLLLFGIACAIHSAVGMSQFKHFVSIHESSEEEWSNSKMEVPVDIIGECMCGLLCVILGIVSLNTDAESLKAINQITDTHTGIRLLDSLYYTEDFQIFSHRKHPMSVMH